MPIIHCSRCQKTWVVARRERRCGKCHCEAPEITVEAAVALLNLNGRKGGERRAPTEPPYPADEPPKHVSNNERT